MVRLIRIVFVLGLLLALFVSVSRSEDTSSRYSTDRQDNTVTLKDTESNQEISVIVHGADRFGRAAKGGYVYGKGKDMIVISIGDAGQDFRPIKNRVVLSNKKGKCHLSVVNRVRLNDKKVLVIYIDKSSLTASECGTVGNVKEFNELYPERAEHLLAKVEETVEIIR